MASSKIVLVAQREYLENVRTKTFWLGILSFPLIFVVATGIGWIMSKTKKTQEYTVLDYTPTQVAAAIEQNARSNDIQRTLDGLMANADQPTEGTPPPRTVADVQRDLDQQLEKLPADSPLRELIADLRHDPELLLQAEQAAATGKLRDVPPKLMAKMFAWTASLTPEQQRSIQTLGSARKYKYVSPAELGLAGKSRDEQRDELNARINDGRLFAYFVFDNDPLERRPSDAPADPARAPDFVYTSNNLTDTDLRDWYADAATKVVRRLRIQKAAIEPAAAAWIQQEVRFKEDQVDLKTGKTKDVEKADKGNKFAPVAFVYMLWIAVFTAAQMLLTNTVEEKSNRIIEVLLSSVSPGELMAGKIWGIGATGLTIVGSWVVFGLLGVWIAPKLVPEFGELNLIAIVGDPLYLASFVGYFLTGYLLFAAILVAIGSVCNSLKEAQNLLQPVFLLLMLPLFAMIPIVQEPNGLMARVFTYVPIYTPFAMMNRASGPPPAWEYAVTTVLILVSVAVAFKAAGKIFRIGVLMTGNPPKLKEILGWLREK